MCDSGSGSGSNGWPEYQVATFVCVHVFTQQTNSGIYLRTQTLALTLTRTHAGRVHMGTFAHFFNRTLFTHFNEYLVRYIVVRLCTYAYSDCMHEWTPR